MSDSTHKAIGLGIAGGAIAAAILDHLVAKGVIVADEQRAILDDAMYRAAMQTGTFEGHEATKYIGTLLDALPSDAATAGDAPE
jgi:polyhydroxyalkanoate synthesis regulator phasin